MGEGKTDTAFLTIGELADRLGVPTHVLRYWETRFPQLKPLQRAGKRRYYRVEDVALATRIHRLLNAEGYTVKGVQQLLAGNPADAPANPEAADREALVRIRDRLAAALEEDEGSNASL